MKKNSIYALMSAIALSGTIGFSSCSSSSDDVVINNPDYNLDDNTVKTQFAISIPSNVNAPKTRMSDTKVQQADNSFRGMDNIVLIPFVGKPTAATNGSAGDPIGLEKITAMTNLTSSNDNYKVYTNVTVPLGTSAFLFYGQADNSSGTDFENGKTTKVNPATAGTAGYTFTPVSIYDGTAENTIGNNIATYLTNIAKATGWSESTGGLKTLYNAFIQNKAGSSATAQQFVKNLFDVIKGNTDAVSEAIITAMGTTYGAVSGTGAGRTLSFATSIDGYPANLNLPDGAAAVKWDETNSKFDVDNTGTTVATLQSYVYPAALWYTANTEILVSKTKQANNEGAYPAARTAWSTDASTGVLGLYTDGSAVDPTTRSVALVDQIQYAVGRLDVTVKCAAGTLYDQQGNAVSVDADNGFPVSAVLIGGQKAVDFTFSNPTGDPYTIYDKEVSGVKAKNNSAVGKNYTLALETAAEADVSIAIELTNNTGADFYGKNGQLIPAGCKFYLTTTLSAASATETDNKIFKQDYYTIANLTIQTGTSGTTNSVGLGSATNTIPDLRTPALELGLAVDLHWQAGHTFSVEL